MKQLLVGFAFLILCSSPGLAARPEPAAQMDAFFKTLGEKGAGPAITDLSKGTLLESQKGGQLGAFAPQLDAALKIYGKISRIENIDKKLFGESFMRHRVITYHASGAPLFWEFMFFKNKGEWEVYIFQFNDQFKKVFGETP